MRFLCVLILAVSIYSADKGIILPIESDIGFMKIGFSSRIPYSQNSGPDFDVFNISPMGINAGWELSVYNGRHPQEFKEGKLIKIIKIIGQSPWEVEIQEITDKARLLAVGYYGFGHWEKWNEKGERVYGDQPKTLQIMVSASSVDEFERIFKTLSFSVVK